MKKTIAILLAVVMLLGCIGVAAVSAAETTVPGSVIFTNNGIGYTANKDSTFTYNVYATAPEIVENGQYYITYPETLFEVQSCSMPNTPGAMYNYDDNLTDEIRLNFSNTNGSDLTTEKLLIEVQFKVVGEGNGSIVFHPELMCNLKDVSIVNQVIFRETIDGADVYTPTEWPGDDSNITDPTTPSESEATEPTTEPIENPTTAPGTTSGTVNNASSVDFGKGADGAAVDKAIKNLKNDKDPKGSTFNLLQVKNTSTTKKSIKLTYKKPSGTKKFVIYANQCGKSYKKVKELKAKSFTYNNLKKGKYYKFLVVALNSKGKVVATSKTIHVATKGGKNGNPTKVKITNATATKKLKNGKSIKLKTKVTAVKVKTHREVKFESTDTKILTVNSKGKVTAKKKGTATIYAYAQNGVMAKVTIKVK